MGAKSPVVVWWAVLIGIAALTNGQSLEGTYSSGFGTIPQTQCQSVIHFSSLQFAGLNYGPNCEANVAGLYSGTYTITGPTIEFQYALSSPAILSGQSLPPTQIMPFSSGADQVLVLYVNGGNLTLYGAGGESTMNGVWKSMEQPVTRTRFIGGFGLSFSTGSQPDSLVGFAVTYSPIPIQSPQQMTVTYGYAPTGTIGPNTAFPNVFYTAGGGPGVSFTLQNLGPPAPTWLATFAPVGSASMIDGSWLGINPNGGVQSLELRFGTFQTSIIGTGSKVDLNAMGAFGTFDILNSTTLEFGFAISTILITNNQTTGTMLLTYIFNPNAQPTAELRVGHGSPDSFLVFYQVDDSGKKLFG